MRDTTSTEGNGESGAADKQDRIDRAVAKIEDTICAQAFQARSAGLPETVSEFAPELLGPNPTPLERLLVRNVLSTMGHLKNVERHHALTMSGSIQLLDFWQRRLERAQRMHLRAIEALARVRRLQIPALVQVNIDQRNAG